MWRQILFWVLIAGSVCGQSESDTLVQVYMDGIQFRVKKPLKLRSVSLERGEFLTMAGALEDPSRLLIKYPGISTANDQANAIIYHGMPSQYHRWSMYGARILNPNHLSNAGTVSDLPSRTSGGVNALSGQVLGSLNFHGSPSSKSIDALSGSSDLELRDAYQNSIVTNLSLIGIEAGIDRSFEKHSSNLIANYRYSTVGLLTGLGLDFGGERINYQDFTTKYSIDKPKHSIDIYAAVGRNMNVKDALSLDSIATEIKERQAIDYKSELLILGASFQKKNNLHQTLNTTVNFSHRNTSRSALLPNEFVDTISSYANKETLLSVHHEYQKNKIGLNEQVNSSYGYIFDGYIHNGNLKNDTYLGLITNYDRRSVAYTNMYAIPRLRLTQRLTHDWNLDMNVGVHLLSSDNTTSTFVGNIEALYDQQDLSGSIALSRSAQAYEPELMLYTESQDFITSTNLELKAIYKGFGASTFYHKLDDLPYMTNFGFSAIDQLDYLPISSAGLGTDLGQVASADIYGASIFAAKQVLGIKVTTNLTLTQSTYEAGTLTSDVPLDYGHIFNLTLGKEWRYKNGKKLGLSSALHQRGGNQYNNVNISESTLSGITNYDNSSLYGQRLADYYRLDLRIYYKPSIRSTISLDIQNLTSRQNEAFYYYEPLTQSSTLKRQLGLIPILSWRVYW